MIGTGVKISAALIVSCVLIASAWAREGLLFDGESVSSTRDSKQRIRVGERLTLSQLKQRFPTHTIQPISGDCGGKCFNISTPDGSFQISYGGAGKNRFYLLTSDAPSASDVLGNRVGMSLRAAIGAAYAHCDDGMATSCDSARIRGLSYDVGDRAGCAFPPGIAKTPIPACAIVGGFRILR